MKSSKLIAIVIAIIAVIWIGSGFVTGSSQDDSQEAVSSTPENPQEKPLQKVRVRDIKAEPYSDSVIVTGRSQASRRVELKAEISSVVQKIIREEGAIVKAGDALASLELQNRAVKRTEARERVNQYQIEYNASKKLAERGFTSKVRLAQSLANLEDAKAELSQVSLNLANTKITAPFDGVIAEQSIDLGDYVDTGEALFTIVDLNPLEFVGFVSERRVQELKTGEAARAELLDGTTIEGIISYIAPAANEQTRTFRIIVSADNSDGRLKEGLTAKLVVPLAAQLAHKISPSILSLNAKGEIGVKTVSADNIVEFHTVKILTDKPGEMWISNTNAQKENGPDRFITVGQDFVIEGQEVEPVAAQGGGLL